MGAFNALDELLPGPESDDRLLEPASRPPARQLDRDQERGRDFQPDLTGEPAAPPRKGSSAFNALDELLPGPMAARRRLRLVPESPPGGGSRHLSNYNPLDDLRPEQPPPKARVSLRVSAELLEAARNASAYLSDERDRVTLGELAEEALRAELLRLASEHNRGRPFPPRPSDERKGRPAR